MVPAGATGTFYADPRCDYTGTLTGKGTFNVYDSWIRCTFSGDWSKFEGTVIPRVTNRSAGQVYDNTTFDFTNSYGLPKATLNIPSGVTVSNNGKTFALGSVIGSGTLAGAGAWIVGGNNADFTFGVTATSKVIKRGSGRMWILTTNKLQDQVQVDEGTLSFTTGTTNPVIGSTLVVNGNAQVQATGLVSSIVFNDNSVFTAVNPLLKERGGVFKTSALFRMNDNSQANFVISSGNGSQVVNSKIDCGNFLYLTNVNVTLGSSYVPAVGDSICLWTCKTLYQAPTSITLPVLPTGMEWESSSLTNKSATGYMRIMASTGIKDNMFADETTVEVFTLSGIKVGEFQCSSSDLPRLIKGKGLGGGTFVVRSSKGSRVMVVK